MNIVVTKQTGPVGQNHKTFECTGVAAAHRLEILHIRRAELPPQVVFRYLLSAVCPINIVLIANQEATAASYQCAGRTKELQEASWHYRY